MPRTISDDRIATAKAADPGREFMVLGDPRSGDEFLFKVPGRAEYDVFQSLAFDDATRSQAARMLLDKCAIDPSPTELSSFLDRQPGMVGTLASPLLEAAGQGVAVTVKKV